MRPALALAALVVASMLAGCNSPVRLREPAPPEPEPLPWMDTARGRGFGSLVAPDWKAGYRFAYQDEGSFRLEVSGDGPDGSSNDVQGTDWSSPGLNYTVVNVEPVHDRVRYLALHHDDAAGGPAAQLLAIHPADLHPQPASMDIWCGWSRDCGDFAVQVHEAPPDAHPLDFPLVDGQGRTHRGEWIQEPYVADRRADVLTRILGMKEVEGPFGKVQAVHVHQDVVLNLTDEANDDERGPRDVHVEGQVRAERDVLYAPSLLNVVLDQSVSEGRLNGSYQLDGERHEFARTWRTWSTHRLVDAELTPGDTMGLDEIAARLRTGTAGASESVPLHLAIPTWNLNVARGESTTIGIALPEGADPFRLRIDVHDGWGELVASSESTALTFQPVQVGPYLVVASAYDAKGTLLGQDVRTLGAYYEDEVQGDCDTIASGQAGGCPAIEVPVGASISFVMAFGTFGQPVAGGQLGGRLVLDLGDGVEVSSDDGMIWLEDPPAAQPHTAWTLRYEPELAIGQSVRYDIDVWPGPLPSEVWDRALRSV